MSSLGISFSGLASGLNTRALIDALVAVESRPIKGMEDRQKSLRQAKNLFGSLDSLLDKLRDTANSVRRSGNFLDYKVALDDETRLTATAGANAQVGTWDVEVIDLARARVSASNGRADHNTTGYGTGTLLLSDGTTTAQVAIDGTNNTLAGIASAISAAGLDVQAQVLDTGGTGNDRYKLVVSGTKTGAANSFTLTFDEGSAALQDLVGEINSGAAGNRVVVASDARFKVNSVELTRAINTVSDAIPGLTLDLKGTHPLGQNQKTRITVTTDTTKTAEKVKSFVDAYNAVVGFVEGQNELDADGKAKNPLFGDSLLRNVRSTLRGVVGSSVASGNQAYEMLAQVGVTSDRAGRLTLDATKLEAAIKADEGAVERLFTDATNGIATRVYDQVAVFTDAVNGMFKARGDGYDRQLRDIDRRIETAERRLESFETQLVNKFAAMEGLVGRLQGQGSALGSLNSRTTQR